MQISRFEKTLVQNNVFLAENAVLLEYAKYKLKRNLEILMD